MNVLYLSKIVLRSNTPEAKRDIFDTNQMHKTIMSGFNGDRSQCNVLYRVESSRSCPNNRIVILVQSSVQPNWNNLTNKWAGYLEAHGTKEMSGINYINNGDLLSFRLRANTCQHDTTLPNSPRVPLPREMEIDWLKLRALKCGFELVNMTAEHESCMHIGSKGMANSTRFEGVLRITDINTFLTTLQHGIGREKAFGFGLLSISRLGVHNKLKNK